MACAEPRRRVSRGTHALVLPCVVALHFALIWLLGEPAASRARREALGLEAQRVTLRLIGAAAPPALTRISKAPASAARPKPRSGARTRMVRENSATREPAVSEGISVAAPGSVAGAEPAASAPAQLPSLLDTAATRRAIRASAREPSLTEQVAERRVSHAGSARRNVCAMT